MLLRFVKPGFATRIVSLDVPPLSADELSLGAIALEISTPGAFTLCRAVQVYIDGVRTNGVNLDAYPPSRVQAMEVYTRPSQIPPEFNAIGSVCGVVAIWTK